MAGFQFIKRPFICFVANGLCIILYLLSLWGCTPQSRKDQSSVELTVTTVVEPEYLAAERDFFAGFTRDTGIRIRLFPVLESVTDRTVQYRRFFDQHSPIPDVIKLDVIWPGMFSNDLLDLKPYFADIVAQQFPALVQNTSIGGKLIGIPITTDLALLYYRSDLLRKYAYSAPPRSWEELQTMAAHIQAGERRNGNRGFWGYVWQGAAYEGLTCNALEWQDRNPAQSIIDATGKITVNRLNTVASLERAARWVGTISPPAVVDYKEIDSTNLWQAGNAAFMRNWQFDFQSSQAPASAVRDRVGVAQLPSGGVVGGGAFAVSRYSLHRAEAVQLIRYCASRGGQQELLRRYFSLPTRPDIYRDRGLPPLVEALLPIGEAALRRSFVRPSAVAGEHYATVSRAYFTAVHSVLMREHSAHDALDLLALQLAEIPGLRLPATD